MDAKVRLLLTSAGCNVRLADMKTDDIVEVIRLIRDLKRLQARLPRAKMRIDGAIFQLTNLVPHEHLDLVEKEEVDFVLR